MCIDTQSQFNLTFWALVIVKCLITGRVLVNKKKHKQESSHMACLVYSAALLFVFIPRAPLLGHLRF